MPYITLFLRIRSNKLTYKQYLQLPHATQEYLLSPYDTIRDTMTHYTGTCIEFGYMTMFITVLPVSTFGALLSNFFQKRIDGWKWLNLYQRPVPASAEDIGVWHAVFSIMSTAAILTNAGIIVFTMSILRVYSLYLRMWIFVIFILFCLFTRSLFAILIPNEPKEVRIQKDRQEFLVSKIIDKVADDDDDDEDDNNNEANGKEEDDNMKKRLL
jgi:hypothetical protein